MATMTLLAVVAAIAFALGGAIGYAANGSGKTWRRRFETERDYYAMYRRDSERAQAAAAKRIAALEERLPSFAPAAEVIDHAPEALQMAPISQAEDEVAADPVENTAAIDTLTRIRGIDAPLAARLAALGVTRFDDIETMSAEDEMALELKLALPAGRIAHDQWRLQAMLLGSGDENAQARLLAARAVS